MPSANHLQSSSTDTAEVPMEVASSIPTRSNFEIIPTEELPDFPILMQTEY
jgi:hypothetical protein